jgi:hypothetical protein
LQEVRDIATPGVADGGDFVDVYAEMSHGCRN